MASNNGRKDNQEDCICPSLHKLNKECSFFILCDGMGGHDNGEVASATVCSAFQAPIAAFARAVQAIVDKDGAPAEEAAE